MAKSQTTILKFPKVRGSFLAVNKPRAFTEGDDEKYEATALLDVRKNPEHKRVKQQVLAEIERIVEETWRTRPKNLKIQFCGNGDDRIKEETGEVTEGYAGMWWVKGKSNKPPKLFVREDGDLIEIAGNDARLQSGMYFNMTMNLYVPKPGGKKRLGPMICCGLRGIQALGYGEVLGGGASPKEFEDFDSEDEGDEDDTGI